MNVLWTALRRLGTSFMLVAALAFAFHNAAVAADLGSLHDCAGHVHASPAHEHAASESAAHEHAVPAHDHADGGAASHSHQHASAAHNDSAGTGQKDGCKVPCCGSACTTALLAAPVLLQVIDAPSAALAFAPAKDLREALPHGLKRPPRPPLEV
jgi:hypothetical protein